MAEAPTRRASTWKPTLGDDNTQPKLAASFGICSGIRARSGARPSGDPRGTVGQTPTTDRADLRRGQRPRVAQH
eukprot:759590-Pyramimonas_sp.AAC.1